MLDALPGLSIPEQQNRLRKIIGTYYIRIDSLNNAEPIITDWFGSSSVDRTDAGYYLALVCLKMNRLQEADSLFTHAFTGTEHRYDSRILFERANIAYQRGQNSTALEQFQLVLNRYPYLSLADTSELFIAQLFLMNHQYKQSAEMFSRVIAKDSLKQLAFETGLIDQPPLIEIRALTGLAKAYEAMENYDKARECYNRAHEIALYEDLNTLHIHMARISEKQGFIKRAIGYLQNAMKVPTDSLADWIGLLYEESGQYNEAYTIYQDALKRTSDQDMKVHFNQKIVLNLLISCKNIPYLYPILQVGTL